MKSNKMVKIWRLTGAKWKEMDTKPESGVRDSHNVIFLKQNWRISRKVSANFSELLCEVFALKFPRGKTRSIFAGKKRAKNQRFLHNFQKFSRPGYSKLLSIWSDAQITFGSVLTLLTYRVLFYDIPAILTRDWEFLFCRLLPFFHFLTVGWSWTITNSIIFKFHNFCSVNKRCLRCH